jgi:glutaredoxin
MNKKYVSPYHDSFTVYSKSNCIYCSKIKQLLNEYNIQFTEVNCDNYILDNKDHFLSFIKSYTKIDYTTFPIVFAGDHFVGGYTDTVKYLEKTYVIFNESF